MFVRGKNTFSHFCYVSWFFLLFMLCHLINFTWFIRLRLPRTRPLGAMSARSWLGTALFPYRDRRQWCLPSTGGKLLPQQFQAHKARWTIGEAFLKIHSMWKLILSDFISALTLGELMLKAENLQRINRNQLQIWMTGQESVQDATERNEQLLLGLHLLLFRQLWWVAAFG